VLVGEWARLVRAYGERMSRRIDQGEVVAALTWLEPTRDTRLARDVAGRLLERDQALQCVWTGTRLRSGGLDIDHCLPWSAWPCSDLWNLLPATSTVNQHLKRDRIPSAAALARARERVLNWWQDAWLEDPALRVRFMREVLAALPLTAAQGAAAQEVSPDEAFAALEWRRLRLQQDSQVEEWAGGS
jgi:hypothetical protein